MVINIGFRRSKIKRDFDMFKQMPIKERKKQGGLIVIGSIILMANWLVFIIVMNHVSVKAASLSYLVCPILTTLLGFFILKEQLGREKWIAVAISVMSCLILSFGHLEDLLYSLFVALAFAFYLIIQRQLNRFDSFNLLMMQLLVVALLMLPFAWKMAGPVPTEPVFYYCISAIVLLFTIVPMFLNNFALKGINSSTAGILIYLNPIVNFLLAIFYYKEAINGSQIMAYGLILVSILVFNSRIIFKQFQAKKTNA